MGKLRIMKKIIILLLLLSNVANAQLLEEFQKKAAASGLQFTMPPGYKVTTVSPNPDLQYSFAIVNEANTMEVRYSLFPMAAMLKEYEESKKDPNVVMVNPNNIYKGIMMSNLFNMTNGKGSEVVDFPTEAVKKEFNAEYGGVAFFAFECQFGKGWKYGQAVCLHKENTADVIITFMSNDSKTHSDLMEIPFHALTFK